MDDQKIHVIGDDDMVVLFALLGIEGTILKDSNEFLKKFNTLIKNPSIGMVIIAVNFQNANFIDYITEYKLNNRKPFIFYLPDIFNPNIEHEETFLKEISKSIGKIIS